MKLLKETKEYKVFKKRNDRYAVQNSSGEFVNSADKIKILMKEGLVKGGLPSTAAPLPFKLLSLDKQRELRKQSRLASKPQEAHVSAPAATTKAPAQKKAS